MIKSDKNSPKAAIIITSAIVITVIAAVIFTAFGLPVLRAKNKFSKILKDFSALRDSDIIVVSDPNYTDGALMPQSVEVMYSGEDAEALANALLSVTESASFDRNSRENVLGSWDIGITLRTEKDAVSLYLRKDGTLYFSDGDKRSYFRAENTDEYEAFYNRICDNISEKAGKTE